jgi:hypothetical protein
VLSAIPIYGAGWFETERPNGQKVL